MATNLKGGILVANHRPSVADDDGQGVIRLLLPTSIREEFVEELDQFLEAFSSNPDPEAVTAFVIEYLETFADDKDLDDIISDLEESGALDGPLQEVLENEMASNEEFEFTGEEILSLLERLCDIEYDDDVLVNDDDDEDEDEDDF